MKVSDNLKWFYLESTDREQNLSRRKLNKAVKEEQPNLAVSA